MESLPVPSHCLHPAQPAATGWGKELPTGPPASDYIGRGSESCPSLIHLSERAPPPVPVGTGMTGGSESVRDGREAETAVFAGWFCQLVINFCQLVINSWLSTAHDTPCSVEHGWGEEGDYPSPLRGDEYTARIDPVGDDRRSCRFPCRVYRSDWRAVQGIGHSRLDYLRFLCHRHFSQTGHHGMAQARGRAQPASRGQHGAGKGGGDAHSDALGCVRSARPGGGGRGGGEAVLNFC